jgi:hypothetical protein
MIAQKGQPALGGLRVLGRSFHPAGNGSFRHVEADIVGALANLGQRLSDQTVGNILRRYGVPPAPKRKHTTSWKDFIRAHMDVLVGTDFFTVEVLTLKGLVTYYVLFFIQLESRRVELFSDKPGETLLRNGAAGGSIGSFQLTAENPYDQKSETL